MTLQPLHALLPRPAAAVLRGDRGRADDRGGESRSVPVARRAEEMADRLRSCARRRRSRRTCSRARARGRDGRRRARSQSDVGLRGGDRRRETRTAVQRRLDDARASGSARSATSCAVGRAGHVRDRDAARDRGRAQRDLQDNDGEADRADHDLGRRRRRPTRRGRASWPRSASGRCAATRCWRRRSRASSPAAKLPDDRGRRHGRRRASSAWRRFTSRELRRPGPDDAASRRPADAGDESTTSWS